MKILVAARISSADIKILQPIGGNPAAMSLETFGREGP
jgi:hypothetical protein